MTNERYGQIIKIDKGVFTAPLTPIRSQDYNDLFFRDERLLSLEETKASNHIGGSVLAISSDGFLVYQRQSKDNEIAPSAFAASGSGSFDWEDLETQPDVTLRDLVVHGVERELSEELTVKVGPDNCQTILTGVYRSVQRGGKPEFCAVSYLKNQTAAMIRVNPADNGYTKEVATEQIGSLDYKVQYERISKFADRMYESNACSYSFKITLYLYIAYLEREIAHGK